MRRASGNTVTLNGTANPNGAPTSAQFEYGLTTAYGRGTPLQSLGSGVVGVAIGAGAITGLQCSTEYHFRAVAANSGGTVTGADATFNTAAFGPGCVFTDATFTPGVTVIKVVHITELRARVGVTSAVRPRGFVWTDPAVTGGATIIRAQHIVDLRAALNDVYVTANVMPPTYTDPGLTTGTTAKAIHIAELRGAVLNIKLLSCPLCQLE